MARYKKALITGASRGLGAALARELAMRRYALVLLARNLAELESLKTAIGDAASVEINVCDLSSPASLSALCESLAADARDIDVLINNAGIGTYKPLADWSAQEIVDCTTVNVTAPMLLSRALLPSMTARKCGYIINVASDLSRRPLANMAPYVASKHAVLGFSLSLLREVKQHNIKVSAVLPGIIDTAFNGAVEGSKEETWALRPAELAVQIANLLDLPENMVIDELTVHPLHQDF
ncbi:MAG: SDR family NAD(P)-dependent oxidoreductase [Casimicrobium sp.]